MSTEIRTPDWNGKKALIEREQELKQYYEKRKNIIEIDDLIDMLIKSINSKIDEYSKNTINGVIPDDAMIDHVFNDPMVSVKDLSDLVIVYDNLEDLMYHSGWDFFYNFQHEGRAYSIKSVKATLTPKKKHNHFSSTAKTTAFHAPLNDHTFEYTSTPHSNYYDQSVADSHFNAINENEDQDIVDMGYCPECMYPNDDCACWDREWVGEGEDGYKDAEEDEDGCTCHGHNPKREKRIPIKEREKHSYNGWMWNLPSFTASVTG